MIGLLSTFVVFWVDVVFGGFCLLCLLYLLLVVLSSVLVVFLFDVWGLSGSVVLIWNLLGVLVNFFDVILWPIKWLVEMVLVGSHTLLTDVFGLAPWAGLTWVLAVLGLVVVVRTAMIPLFVKTIRSTAKVRDLAPLLKAVHDKYKDAPSNDVASREAMSRELMDVYRTAGANPGGFLVPLLIQLPIFAGLFAVLNHASRTQDAGVGLMDAVLVRQFYGSEFFGLLLHDNFAGALTAGSVQMLAVVAGLVVVMSLLSALTVFLGSVENAVSSRKKVRVQKAQYVVMIISAVGYMFSGVALPLMLLFYMLFSAAWTTVQQVVLVLVRRRAVRRAS
jgi:YidC/Oxa1 family membrane protein insertase